MGFVADHEVIVAGYAGPWTVDIADFEDLVLENDLLTFPRA
jgi:hypothetical protein